MCGGTRPTGPRTIVGVDRMMAAALILVITRVHRVFEGCGHGGLNGIL